MPSSRAWTAVPILLVLGAVFAIPVARAAPQVVDAFESVDGWGARPADGVEMKLSSDVGAQGRSLRIDFRFVKGGGYAVLHRDLALTLPENYRFTFRLRGECPDNNLEFKLIDSTGSNVWWCNRRDVRFPREWETVTIKRRHIQFAWGPAGGGEIRRVAALEFAVTAGSGGAGTVWLDQLELTALPPAGAAPPPVRAEASSLRAGHEPERAIDGDPASDWRSGPRDRVPWFMLDLQAEREFGGLVIDWGEDGHPDDYIVDASDDGETWRVLRTVRDGRRAQDALYLPESEARFVRVRGQRPYQDIAIREIAVRPLEWAASREAFFQALAQNARRGSFPRGMSGEQVYWTVLSVDGGPRKGLISEDGAIETGRGSFSIEPFLFADRKLLTWADVEIDQSLDERVLPIPSVQWRRGEHELSVTAFAYGPRDSSSIVASYQVSNHGDRRREVTLFLAIRPFQVNPPAQFLNLPGGTAPIRELSFEKRRVRVNRDRVIESLTPSSGVGAVTFDQGDIVDYLRAGRLPKGKAARDSFEACSGAFAYDLVLPPGGVQSVDLLIPLYGWRPWSVDASAADSWADGQLPSIRSQWRERIGQVELDGPSAGPDTLVVAALQSQLAWILATRAGAALQPGTRSYARSWIRDGALIGTALLRLGQPEAVREFIEWFAPYQYDDGKIPCCVDARGSDPVPEHDSAGEFIYLVTEYYRYTGNRDLAVQLWPRVRAAAGYLDSLRRQRRTAEWRAPGKEPFFGLLPPSISHEGYSAKPMHSYWDDLFALRGFKDAAFLAQELGQAVDARRIGAIRDTFARELGASVAAAMAAHHIDYVPGCADLGDFDATSTAIAISPVQAEGVLPRGSLERTFERYWTFFTNRRDGREPWEAFTPYELRTAGAMVRLGQRKRALEMLEYFLSYCRPRGWLQWPEVVWKDARAPKFLGDLPHAWVGAEYVHSVLDLFVYERERDRSLVVGAGVPMAWLRSSDGIGVDGVRTPYGSLELSESEQMGVVDVRVHLRYGSGVPPGGVAVRAPFDGPIRRATVDGREVKPNAAGEVIVREVPARLRLEP